MSRSELKKKAASRSSRTKRRRDLATSVKSKSDNEAKLSDVKAHFSEVVRQARAGRTTVVTDHGLPVAVVAPIAPKQGNKIEITPARNPFSSLHGLETRVLTAAESSLSILDLLRDDRDSR